MFAPVRTGAIAIGATAAFALLASSALAEILTYKVDLRGSRRFPPIRPLELELQT